MPRPSLALALAPALALLWTTAGRADPPQIASIAPLGVRRGAATDVTIAGQSLAGRPRLVAPFGFQAGPPATPGDDAGKWRFRLEVAAETPVGVYPIRVRTDDGLSNPFLIAVGQVETVAEVEDNSRFELAQPIPTPSVVEGQAAGADVDYFKFAGKKGQTIVLDAQCARIGSGVDPTIRLTTASRRFVGSADDSQGLLTDARLVATLPEDGDYVVELSDSRYQGGGRPVYRLLVGSVPVADEVYPLGGRRGETVGLELRGGTIGDLRLGVARLDAPRHVETHHLRLTAASLGLGAAAGGLDVESLPSLAVDDIPEIREPADPSAPPARATPPVVFNGRIESKGDEDLFVLAVTPGQRLRIEVSAAALGSALDGVLQIRGAGGAVLATADDTVAPASGKMKNKKAPAVLSPDPSIDFTVPGTLSEITLALRDLKGDGGVGYPYRLTVEPIVASFDVALAESEISVPRGGSASIGVTIARKGYNGPITLDVVNPPSGLTVRPGLVGDGQVAGSFTVTASADAGFDRVDLDVVGRGGPSTVPATKLLVFAQQGPLPTNVVAQLGLPAATALAPAVGFEIPAAPIEVAHGSGADVPIKLARTKGADAALAIAALPMPPGFTLAGSTIAEKAAEGKAALAAAVEAPLGLSTVVLTAKGKVDGKDRTYVLPAVSLRVVRPAAVEVAGPAAIKPGATVEIQGKLARKGAFKEPVTIKLEGLPAGLKAEPITVPPDKSEFTFKLVADATASPTSATARIAVAFQVNKKDYATPPTPLDVKVVAAK